MGTGGDPTHMNLEGLIPLAGGVYGWLLVTGTLPKHPKNPEKMAAWRQRYGTIVKVICPLLVIFGALQLIGVLK